MFDRYRNFLGNQAITVLNPVFATERERKTALSPFQARRMFENAGSACAYGSLMFRCLLYDICDELGEPSGLRYRASDIPTKELLEIAVRALDTGRLLVVPEWYMAEEISGRAVAPKVPSKAQPASQPEEESPAEELTELWLRLALDPNDAAVCGDRFELTGSDGYSQTKTVRDDKEPGDRCIDLQFTRINPNSTFTLRVIPSEGQPYEMFRNVAYRDLGGETEKETTDVSSNESSLLPDEVGSTE